MIGKTISHYKIIEKIGEGGMGVVYKAEDATLKRTVAIKFLPPDLTRDPETKRRFVQEAQAASGLDHHNICTIHEVGEPPGGRMFMVMAYYKGETLKTRIEDGPLENHEAIGIIKQISKGLAKAHKSGIVHRDIKPANIMVTDDGVVKILDFGVAKLAGQARLTKTGSTVGTAAYMSPEQVRGDDVDHRADIWSLGVVLYEMLTGQLPFGGDHEQAVLYSIVNEEPAPASTMRTDLPDTLDQVLKRALEKNPDARHQSVDEFLADLGLIKATVGTTEHPVLNRSPRKARLGWLVVPAAVAGVLGYWVISNVFVGRDDGKSTGRQKIVVLPFENLGPPEDEYFADGITEELTARLAKIGGLGVIARTSAIRYKNTDKTIGQIGDELGVDYVLEGSIRWDRVSKDQSRIRVTPQLIRVSDQTHVWADIYQRDMTSIFEVQSDIAEKVAGALDITLLESAREAIEAKPTENIEAYNAYLRGLNLLGVPDYRVETRGLAIQMLERAVEIDTNFALAYAELSVAHSEFFNLGYDRSKDRVAKAKTAVDRALELDPDHPVVHKALGYYYYLCRGEYDRALEQFVIAAEGLPNDSSVIQAVEYFKLSIALAPGQDTSYHFLGWTYRLWQSDTVTARAFLDKIPLHDEQLPLASYIQSVFERDYRAALKDLEAGPPDRVFLTQWWYYPVEMLEGVAHRLMGQTESARAAFEAARIRLEALITEQPDDSRLHGALGIVFAGLERKEDAIHEGRLATELLPVSRDAYLGPRRVEDLVLICTMVGECDAAFDEIERLLSIPSYFSVGLLRLDPQWDPLRDHPRYKLIVEKYGENET